MESVVLGVDFNVGAIISLQQEYIDDPLNDPVGAPIYQILRSDWESYSGVTSTPSNASMDLVDLILQSDDVELCLDTCFAVIHAFTCTEPIALDRCIDTLAECFALLPNSISTSCGSGRQGAHNYLRFWLHDHARFFQNGVLPVEVGDDTAGPDVYDHSNVIFTAAEVSESRQAVLKKLQNQRRKRLSHIVALAMRARCYSKILGYRKDKLDETSVWFVDSALNPQRDLTPE